MKERITVIIALLFACTSIVLAEIPNDCHSSVESYWKFDVETGTNVVDSYGDNNGSIYFGVIRNKTGILNRSFEFDGVNDYVQVPSDSSLNLQTEITLEAWVNLDNINNHRYIIDKSRYGAYSLSYNTDQRIHFYTNGLSAQDSSAYVPSTSMINTWNHIVATYNGTHKNIFFNGANIMTVGATGLIGISTNPVRIGNSHDNYEWDGLIDEVAIYNEALSSQEIEAQFYKSKNYDKNYCEAVDCLDTEGDSVCNTDDNCLYTKNTLQSDTDSDLIGDACDNCVTTFNPNQENEDLDDLGDSCDGCHNDFSHPNMVSYWSFEEGTSSQAYDSLWDNDASLVNMDDADWVDGILGQSVTLDGSNDYINIPDDSTLDIQDQLTLEAWVNLSSFSNFVHRPIIDKSRSNAYSLIYETNQQLAFYTNNDKLSVYIPFTTMVNNWNHVVATYNGTHKKLFLNGIEKASKSFSSSINTNNNPVRLGRTHDLSSSYRWQGNIDEVAIYNTALNASDISDHYVNVTQDNEGYCPIVEQQNFGEEGDNAGIPEINNSVPSLTIAFVFGMMIASFILYMKKKESL